VKEQVDDLRRCDFWLFSMRFSKYGLEPPWCSALTQGQAASVLVRAWIRTGDDRFAEHARTAIRPLTGVAPAFRLLVYTADGPALEECRTATPSHVLNGWIYALWGLADVATALGDEQARKTFEDSTYALIRQLPTYDLGWRSLYSRYRLPAPDIAKPFYHRLHVAQLIAMSRLTRQKEFELVAKQWAAYDARIRAARVIAHKAAQMVIR
jgi:hypothetical protein